MENRLMNIRDIAVIVSILMLTVTAIAANPLDAITSQVSEQTNAQSLAQNAVEHIVQGNLTQEHLQQDINATSEQLRQKATEKIKQEVNNTTEQISQKAKEEINKQVNQRLGQPGLGMVLALTGILAMAYILRREG